MATIDSTRRIVTMNPERPFATHVAVRDGPILGAGPLDELRGWGNYDLDERFTNKVLMPGLLEATVIPWRERSDARSTVVSLTAQTPMDALGRAWGPLSMRWSVYESKRTHWTSPNTHHANDKYDSLVRCPAA
ncbi:MAG: hypothetical protein ACI8PT_003622 [Gammaproteobacteria bacterium]|jgi:hypothetical protein